MKKSKTKAKQPQTYTGLSLFLAHADSLQRALTGANPRSQGRDDMQETLRAQKPTDLKVLCAENGEDSDRWVSDVPVQSVC